MSGVSGGIYLGELLRSAVIRFHRVLLVGEGVLIKNEVLIKTCGQLSSKMRVQIKIFGFFFINIF